MLHMQKHFVRAPWVPGTSGVRADEELRSRIKTTLQEHQEHFRTELRRTSTEKQRYYSANKGSYSQGYGLPVVTYGYKSWITKKAERQRIDAF